MFSYEDSSKGAESSRAKYHSEGGGDGERSLFFRAAFQNGGIGNLFYHRCCGPKSASSFSFTRGSEVAGTFVFSTASSAEIMDLHM